MLKMFIVYAQLEELVLYGNPLESLPPELFALSRLHTLRLSAREFAETAHLDAHTEQLIARNQLHSVHIPNVIFELPALRALDLTGAPLAHVSSFSPAFQLLHLLAAARSRVAEAAAALSSTLL